MKKLLIATFYLACYSQYALAATTLNWPASGGIEEWGFSRPYGCSSDDQYLMPLAKRMHEQSNWGSVSGVYDSKPGEYTYGNTGQLIRQAKGNEQAIASLQQDLDKMKTELNQLNNDAKSYIQLTSSGYQNGGDVINAIKRFDIVGVNCANMQGNGAANATACGLQAKAFQLTANLERFIQISCHLGGNVPTYAMANMPNNRVSNISSTDTSSVAKTNSTGKSILKGLAAAVGVYAGIQEAKSNSRRQNSTYNQPAQQSSTQTSQNSYPSDSGYQNNNSNQVSSGEEYMAHNCIATNNKGGFKNICAYEVNFSYCVMNSRPLDPNVRMGDANTKCETNSLGSTSLSAGRESSGLYAGHWYWFACRSPAAVTSARFESGGVSAYCKKY